MSWMASNWVERRAAKERYLKNAAGVWKDVVDTIAETCESLRKHFGDVATIRTANQNGDHVHLTIMRTPASGPLTSESVMTVQLSIEFQAQKPAIAVQLDRGKLQEFPIDADADHAFVTFQGRELLLDEFSRLVLENAFFSGRNNQFSYQQQDPDKALEMAKDLIRRLDAESNSRRDKIASTAAENSI